MALLGLRLDSSLFTSHVTSHLFTWLLQAIQERKSTQRGKKKNEKKSKSHFAVAGNQTLNLSLQNDALYPQDHNVLPK